MAKILSAAERQRIADELRTGKSVRQVAELTGRSVGSISKTAADLNIDLERSQTEKATAAHVADARAMLKALAPKLALTANRLLDELWNERSAHAKAQTMIAVGIAMQRSHEVIGPEPDTLELSELERWLLSRRNRHAADAEADGGG